MRNKLNSTENIKLRDNEVSDEDLTIIMNEDKICYELKKNIRIMKSQKTDGRKQNNKN